MFNIVLCQDTCEVICFKLGLILKHDEALQFDSSLNYLDVHTRSQDYGKAGTCAVILMDSSMKQLKCL